MQQFRPRLWFSLGLSVLAGQAALAQGPAPAEACAPRGAAEASLDGGEAGESGEDAGSAAERGAVALLRIEAQLDAAEAAQRRGERETADVMMMAASDEGPARLARAQGKPDRPLEHALEVLALAQPGSEAAEKAGRLVREMLAKALAATPELRRPVGQVDMALRLASEAMAAHGKAIDCGRLADGAAYAEASALAARARRLAEKADLPEAAGVVRELRALAALLPEDPAGANLQTGAVAAATSRALLEASELKRD